jgi:hypothetical protein
MTSLVFKDEEKAKRYAWNLTKRHKGLAAWPIPNGHESEEFVIRVQWAHSPQSTGIADIGSPK